MVNEIDRLKKDKAKALTKGNWKETSELCNCLGVELCKLGDYNEALVQHQEELEICTMLNDKLGIAVSNRRIGECFCEMQNFKKALFHQKTFLNLSVTLNSSVEEQRAWATLGRTYYFKYMYECEANEKERSKFSTLDKSEKSFLRALELSEGLKMTISEKEYAEMKGRLLLNLGLVYEQRGDLTRCAENLKKAIFLTKKFNLHEDLHRCEISLASVYQQHGQFNFALRLMDEAIASAKILHDKAQLCEVLISKSSLLIELKDFESTRFYLKRAYRLHSPIEDDHKKSRKYLKIVMGLCMCQKQLLNLEENDHENRKGLLEKMGDGLVSLECYKLAEEYYLSTLKCMQAVQVPMSEQAPIYFSLAQTVADDGNYSKALEYFQKECDCNNGTPEEQVKTLLKMAEITSQLHNYVDSEQLYTNSLSKADSTQNNRLIHTCLQRIYDFYEDQNDNCKKDQIAERLKKFESNPLSSSDEASDCEESQDPFHYIGLSDLSDCTDSDIEKEFNDLPRSKRRVKRTVAKKNELGETPLHRACITGNFKLVRHLIETGHPVNPRDNCGWLPLHEAANNDYYEIVDYLLENGAWVNDRGGKLCEGVSPLHDAASCGNIAVMKLLISKGASVTALSNNGETPLDSLVKWWKRSEKDLDQKTIQECVAMEVELKKLMKQAGQNGIDKNEITDISLSTMEFSFSSANDNCSSIDRRHRENEKRARSPSSSPPLDNSHYPNPHMDWEMEKDWTDPHLVEKEYQNVMSSFCQRAKGEVEPFPKTTAKKIPALLSEDNCIADWLVEDTQEKVHSSRRKKIKVTENNVKRSSSCIKVVSQVEETMISSEMLHDGSEEAFLANDGFQNYLKSRTDDSSDCRENFGSSPREDPKMHSHTFCIRVRIADKVILVPINDELFTVSMLAEEAAQRYQNLMGQKPCLTIVNKDGALLSGSDCIKIIVGNNDEVSSIIDSWHQLSLVERYEQLCQKNEVHPLTFMNTKLCVFEKISDLDFSCCVIPSENIKLLFTALQSYNTLQNLNLSGTAIGDANFNTFLMCLSNLGSLISLNLSCCCLTSISVSALAKGLMRPNNDSRLLPRLHNLILSYNFFHSHCADAFSQIISLPSLEKLDLRSCNLDSSFFNNENFYSAVIANTSLQAINVSENIICAHGIQRMLSCLARESLLELDISYTLEVGENIGKQLFSYLSQKMPYLSELILQACFLTDEDIKLLCESFSMCPRLNTINLSANESVSVGSLVNIVQAANFNNLPLHNMYATNSCLWDSDSIAHFSSILSLKLLRNIVLDSIPKSLESILFDSWILCWGEKSICNNWLLCELKLK